MRPPTHLSALLLAVACSATQAQSDSLPVTRGALLYDNHCVACHSEQIHWRDKRRAQDWDSLRALVRQWQGEARLGWSEADIDSVARHLNQTIYRFKVPVEVAGDGR
jgi:cytochrome c1